MYHSYRWEHSVMNDSKEWLELGVYVSNLVGEREGGERALMEKVNDFLER